jgi:cell wall-associated NlpC family hydrolase
MIGKWRGAFSVSSSKDLALAHLHRAQGGTRIRGLVLPGRVPEMLDAAAARESWPIAADGTEPLEWRVAEGVAALFDSSAGNTLVTEWDGARGPLMPLKRFRRATLVRCPDGTAGWTRARLGEIVPAPVCPEPTLSLHALNDAIQALLRAPYRLGGASTEGFDCSALVQRIYLDAFNILLPRHSRDQMLAFQVGLDRRRRAMAGDVVFLEMGGGCHAGIVCASSGQRTGVVHAAHSRGVVIDSMSAFRRIGKLIGVGRAEVAFAAALLTQKLPTSAMWGTLFSRALRRALE